MTHAVTPTDNQAADLLRLARSHLAHPGDQPANPQCAAEPADVLVNVTVYVRQRLRASMSGGGATLQDAVRNAAARAAADVRFGPRLSADDLPDARVELWIQTGSETISAYDLKTDVDLGFHGVDIDSEGHFAYYKPSVALTSGLARHDLLLDKLTKKARLPPGTWRGSSATLRRTWWEHYCEVRPGPDRVLHLRRLRPAALEELTPATLQARLRLAADRLMAVQSPQGYYLYELQPFTGHQKPGPGNLVRQAGCAYALGRAADLSTEPQRRALMASSASRALDVLLSRAAVENDTFFIADLPTPTVPVWGKLGSLAMCLAAVQSSSLAGRYQGERQRLVDAVLSWQRPDGSFRCRTDSTSVADDGTSQNYFPGQALMALAIELRAGSGDAQRAMAAALPWYRAHFRTQPATSFVLWQVDAWRLYAEWSMGVERSSIPDAKACGEFVFEMADWLVRLQIGPGVSHPDFVGGFAQPHSRPQVSSATYTEAIIRAFSMAQLLGDTRRANRYREASLLGLDFVRRLQITPDTAALFGDPVSAVGGTTASLSNMTIRCDFDQHTMTTFMAALQTGLLNV